MASSLWETKMLAGGFRKLDVRCGISTGDQWVRKPRFCYRSPYLTLLIAYSLYVAKIAAWGFRNGAFDAVYPLGTTGPQTALPISTSPSDAGGRWLTLGRWPKWRREVLENGAVGAVYSPGITGAPRKKTRASDIDRHARRGRSMAYSW